jgi:hypothetical protein
VNHTARHNRGKKEPELPLRGTRKRLASPSLVERGRSHPLRIATGSFTLVWVSPSSKRRSTNQPEDRRLRQTVYLLGSGKPARRFGETCREKRVNDRAHEARSHASGHSTRGNLRSAPLLPPPSVFRRSVLAPRARQRRDLASRSSRRRPRPARVAGKGPHPARPRTPASTWSR